MLTSKMLTDRQTDGQTDGHANLIVGLVTRNPPKNLKITNILPHNAIFFLII